MSHSTFCQAVQTQTKYIRKQMHFVYTTGCLSTHLCNYTTPFQCSWGSISYQIYKGNFTFVQLPKVIVEVSPLYPIGHNFYQENHGQQEQTCIIVMIKILPIVWHFPLVLSKQNILSLLKLVHASIFLSHHCQTASVTVIFSILQFTLCKSTFSHSKRKTMLIANKKKITPSIFFCKSWVTSLSQLFLMLMSCMCLPKALLCFSGKNPD